MGLAAVKKTKVMTGDGSSSCTPCPVKHSSCPLYDSVIVMSPCAPRILNSKSLRPSFGELGNSNSIPVKGNFSVTRRSSTVHVPWIGSVDVDIGMRMYMVAKPVYRTIANSANATPAEQKPQVTGCFANGGNIVLIDAFFYY